MSKYIGTPVVNVSVDTVDVTGDITTTDTTPEVIIVNNTHEDTDGGREGKLTFKGQQSGGEETTLAQIQASHDGTSDDEKGDLIFKTNDGSDGASPTERMRIDSGGNVGIGTTSPTVLLDLESTDPKIRFTDSDASGTPECEISGAGGDITIRADRDNEKASSIIGFEVDGSERMRIDSSGNVGIASTSVTSLGTGITTLELKGNSASQTDRAGGIRFERYDGTYAGAVYNADGAFYHDAGAYPMLFFTNSTERMRITNDGDVGIGTTSPEAVLHAQKNGNSSTKGFQVSNYDTTAGNSQAINIDFGLSRNSGSTKAEAGRIKVGRQNSWDASDSNIDSYMAFFTYKNNALNEAFRVDGDSNFLVGETSSSNVTNGTGIYVASNGQLYASTSSSSGHFFNVQSDGQTVLVFRHAGTSEGNISISGSTVSYNGGHLSRYSRLSDNSKDTSIVKGTVMTNLNEMVVWSHAAIAEGDEFKNDMGETVTATADDVRDAYTEENEQLNHMAVSSVEGDVNVAGVFVNWDESDDFNDMNVAMTGDMVIRIAQGTTVARGDLLMSAGDGTAKPQGDDIVRSKTIAKVTSTNVSHTYDDGSYLVPCVLMAC